MKEIKIIIDNKEYIGKEGETILQFALNNKLYIPFLCFYKGTKPIGTCRVCTVKVNGRYMAACTTPIQDGMVVESNTEELEKKRKMIIEMLFSEGNHFCPSCEKSGNCELQALAYRYKIDVPRFPYLFKFREVEAFEGGLLIDHNRCVLCKRCVDNIFVDGKHVFQMIRRAHKGKIEVDKELTKKMDDNTAMEAMNICPVGAIIKREIGFAIPIGQRKFDKKVIDEEMVK